jgi:hypothetical protein
VVMRNSRCSAAASGVVVDVPSPLGGYPMHTFDSGMLAVGVMR